MVFNYRKQQFRCQNNNNTAAILEKSLFSAVSLHNRI